MMERLKLRTLELEFVISAFGNFASIFLQWTRPTTFIHRTMNSTTMCLLLERTGEFDSDKDLNQCADMQYNIVASVLLYAAD